MAGNCKRVRERLAVLCSDLERIANDSLPDGTTLDAAKSVEECCKELCVCIERLPSVECLPQMIEALRLLHKLFMKPCTDIAASTGWVIPFYTVVELLSLTDRQGFYNLYGVRTLCILPTLSVLRYTRVSSFIIPVYPFTPSVFNPRSLPTHLKRIYNTKKIS